MCGHEANFQLVCKVYILMLKKMGYVLPHIFIDLLDRSSPLYISTYVSES